MVRVPSLKIDKVLYKDRPMLPRCRVERRIFANLLDHLMKAGFTLSSVWDGGEDTEVTTIKEAMEIAFNLDQCHVYFISPLCGKKVYRWVFFVFGNDGVDCINDWGYMTGDADGFNKAMDAFDPEKFA